MIEVKDLIKKYGDQIAVNKINLKIDKGEVIGLLGPNGAGKTTTMKLISGIIWPDEGEVLIDGKNFIDSEIEIKSKIGFMAENNPLYKEMTVEAFLNSIADIYSLTGEDRESKLKRAVKSTAIQDVYYKNINELSKGFKQRVGLAAAMLPDPQILILDEPTEGLDPNQRVDIRNLIRSIAKDKTVIISTHVLSEVEAMCDRIIIINKGNVIADGKFEEISKLANGKNILEFSLSGKELTKDDISKMIPNIKVLDLNFKSGKNFIQIETKNEKDSIKSINDLIKKNNDLLLESLMSKKQNLEEVFKDLTK